VMQTPKRKGSQEDVRGSRSRAWQGFAECHGGESPRTLASDTAGATPGKPRFRTT
jgi:hypothetical protein